MGHPRQGREVVAVEFFVRSQRMPIHGPVQHLGLAGVSIQAVFENQGRSSVQDGSISIEHSEDKAGFPGRTIRKERPSEPVVVGNGGTRDPLFDIPTLITQRRHR